MKTLFLKFQSAEAADVVIGSVMDSGLVMDAFGTVYKADGDLQIAQPGWHVNVLALELPQALQPFQVLPVTPFRVFAVEPEVVRIPQEVTMAQCRLALFDQHGIETGEQFYQLVDLLPEADRPRALLELRSRPTVRRDNQLVVALGQAMGWDLDALFIYAGGL